MEITHAGQAFRMGRYPVHLHLNGDMSGSYVRGLGIHHSFNRAVNVHGTQNALVEHVVSWVLMSARSVVWWVECMCVCVGGGCLCVCVSVSVSVCVYSVVW